MQAPMRLAIPATGQGLERDEREHEGPDYSKGSPEDKATDAPTGKEETTEADQDLAEDQAALQTDSS